MSTKGGRAGFTNQLANQGHLGYPISVTAAPKLTESPASSCRQRPCGPSLGRMAAEVWRKTAQEWLWRCYEVTVAESPPDRSLGSLGGRQIQVSPRSQKRVYARTPDREDRSLASKRLGIIKDHLIWELAAKLCNRPRVCASRRAARVVPIGAPDLTANFSEFSMAHRESNDNRCNEMS